MTFALIEFAAVVRLVALDLQPLGQILVGEVANCHCVLISSPYVSLIMDASPRMHHPIVEALAM